MHDRRLDGEVLTFGNQSVLYMGAMTWWDHDTVSIWSQPWGAAIDGFRKGKSLTLIPAEVVPWRTWIERHPDTTVLVDENGVQYSPQRLRDNFVVGVALADASVAYYFPWALDRRVVNDSVGDIPVVVHVDPGSRDISVFHALPAGTGPRLTFSLSGDSVVDNETGSSWDLNRGIATRGSLRGAVLRPLPYVTAYDWAWVDFYPHARFHGGEPPR